MKSIKIHSDSKLNSGMKKEESMNIRTSVWLKISQPNSPEFFLTYSGVKEGWICFNAAIINGQHKITQQSKQFIHMESKHKS